MSDSNDDKTIVLGGAASPAAPAPARAGGSNNALPIGTRLSEFEIIDLVGEGGFGIVYLADDHSLQRRVAIKEYMPSSLAARGSDSSVVVRSDRHTETFEIGRRSFVNEARLLAQFDHPALVKVFRFWEANSTAYMAMPFYAGKTLRDVLKERSGPPPDEAWIRKILAPVMDALELIHNENCFHRDIAPDNIMLLRDDRPVLLDFGAARRVISDMTQALTVILKPGYAPIEQYAEMPGVKQGPWTDIYALGAVVYFIITGRTPPPSVGRMMQDAYEPLAVIGAGRYSDQFLQGIDRCLAVKGEERPQSIAEMRQVLGFGETTQFYAPAETAMPGRPRADAADSETTIQPTVAPAPRQQPKAVAASTGTATGAGEKKRIGPVHYAAATAVVGAIAAGILLFGRDKPAGKPEAAPANVASSPASAPAPAAPQSPPPPPPAASGPIPLATAFSAAVAASDSSFELKVDGVKTPLTIGRDQLSFVLHSKRGGYLYLLLWDKASGQLAQIFPNELDRNNTVTAGKSVVFPRPDWAYEADMPKGDWDVIAIVSEARRDFTTLGISGTNGASRETVEAALGSAANGGKALIGAPQCSTQPCPDTYAAVSFSVAEVSAGANAPATRKDAGGKPAQAKDKAAAKPPGNEQADKEYVQHLNKALDQMLSK